MDNSKHWQKTWLGAGATLALLGTTIAPAAAQSARIINGVVVQQSDVGTTITPTTGQTVTIIDGGVVRQIDVGNTITPTTGQTVTIIDGGVVQQSDESSYIYSSPIALPVPINQVNQQIPYHTGNYNRRRTQYYYPKTGVYNTGNYNRRRTQYYHPRTRVYSYPPYPQTIINPNLTYPNLVHPMFRNQPLRNPVFDQRPDYQPNHRRFRGRSRSILFYSR